MKIEELIKSSYNHPVPIAVASWSGENIYIGDEGTGTIDMFSAQLRTQRNRPFCALSLAR